MHVILLLLVTCDLCWTIRVPVSWDEGESEVKNIENDEQFSVESFKPQTDASFNENQNPIPVEYFEYTAKKPQFAVDIAAYHGVQSPENHYKAYPIKPYTGRTKPQLGKHHILDSSNTLHKPLQDYTKINEDIGQAKPVSSSYEVFHPYEAEIPALQQIYKDPTLTKIRNDLENSKNRLQQYETEAGKPDIAKDEYLESPQKTDGKLFPHTHRPAPFEIHRPQRRPVYYRPGPIYNNREQYLNHKLRHPWNHNIAKVRPMHYRPVKNHIQHLRQNHALKYDDERNEYPQVQFSESYSDPKDGYDIYLKGRDKFVQLRNNVDESITKAVEQNRPTTYQKLEIQNNDSLQNNSDGDDEEEFVPIKNYAQVRKTETYRHLPQSAALDDADTYEEIKNAPRLREAVKSTKAQTVYSEEGYEDGAYDHAGEHKHASENEGHGGFLKEKELSGGKYKAPSISANYEDGNGSTFRDQLIHAEKWKDDKTDTKEETEEEDESEAEHEHLLEVDNHETEPRDIDNGDRHKRENDYKNDTSSNLDLHSHRTEDSIAEHEVNKRETNFTVPELDLNTTYLNLNEKKFLKMANLKVFPKKVSLEQKYPYYFENLRAISRNSPLRYAENLKLIPKKSMGGTEFYDSKSKFECPEVDDAPDPVPEKLKGGEHPNGDDSKEENSSTKGDENFDTTKKQPRLQGLGDKIDCFKEKYFGENPLDSPFFKEDIIANPEPVFLPNIAAYKLKSPILIKHKEITAESKSQNTFEKVKDNNTSDLFALIEKLRSDQDMLHKGLVKSKNELFKSLDQPKKQSNFSNSELAQQSSVYNDVIDNIRSSLMNVSSSNQLVNGSDAFSILRQIEPYKNVTYNSFINKEDVTISPTSRKKRSASFVYEPYKIIRDSHVADDLKKTTSNISPLIRQLQPRSLVDRVTNFSPEEVQLVKRNVNTRAYKDIGRKDRKTKQFLSKNDSPEVAEIVDVSEDKRRGEPRYEIKHVNHKSRYTPVTNKKSITKEDYEARMSSVPVLQSREERSSKKAIRQTRPTQKAYFDISKFIPHTTEVQNAAASNTVKKTVSTTTHKPRSQVSTNHAKYKEQENDRNSDEDYEEYDEEEEQEEMFTTTTTTTTIKPAFKRRIRLTTTEEPPDYTEKPKMKLVTRFRDYKPQEKNHHKSNEDSYSEKPLEKSKIENIDENFAPKFREKKKKVTKSTVVTDTKKYGDGYDDMQKEEVDALIGVKQDMDDYEPMYERDEEKESKEIPPNNEDKDDDNDDEDEDDIDEDEDEDEDVDEDEDESEDSDSDNDEDDGSHEHDDEESGATEEDVSTEPDLKATTPEPTKRTLVITTDAPAPTTASRSTKLQVKPIITRKKIEIHKELPVNKSSPHITQFKQDIKEIEIIKETPNPKHPNPLKRKPNKNVEVFDLYKDENLAKDVNQLGVEIFKENLDLRSGPKHGGNYRSFEPSSTVPTLEKLQYGKDDAEASQSEYTKHIETDDDTSKKDVTNSRINQKNRNKPRNSKLIELSDTINTSMHGGNLRYRGKSRNNDERSQKLIELDDDHDDENSSDSQEEKSYSRNGRPMHGGNYRSAKLTERKPPQSESTNVSQPKDARRNAAFVLNSFVQAAPVLTTTPGYILDPSKRKYYYVDA